MQCANEYCIYCEKNKCALPSIRINALGMCDECVIVSLDKNFLSEEKKHQRNEMSSR